MKLNKKAYILLESLFAITIISTYIIILTNVFKNIFLLNNKSIGKLENITYIDYLLSDNIEDNDGKRTDQTIYSNKYIVIKIIKLIDSEGKEKYYEKIYVE